MKISFDKELAIDRLPSITCKPLKEKKPKMIEIKGLRKNLGNFAIKNINLRIFEGEYFVILGPTGAGKTTLLETIAGLIQPDEGKIWLKGKEINILPPECRNIGFVYQDYALFPHLSVVENIKFGLKFKKLDKSTIAQRVSNVMDLLHISHLSSASPNTLSGGEAQRVALARVLVIQPQILLLDEPLSNLDPNLRLKLQSELKKIHQNLMITTIHVTHNFDEAISLADRIGIMHQGEILQVGTSIEIFRQPTSEKVAQFIGCENLFKGELVNQNGLKIFTTKKINVHVVTHKEGEGYICIHPEDIILSKEPVATSARNCFCGKIIKLVEKGILAYVWVDIGEPFVVLITKNSLAEMKLTLYSQVYITFKATAVHVF